MPGDEQGLGLDIDKIAENLNPSGLNPEIEKKAEEYAKRDWQMSVEPMLSKVFTGADALSEDCITELQNALFDHKYEVLEKAEGKKDTAKKLNRRW